MEIGTNTFQVAENQRSIVSFKNYQLAIGVETVDTEETWHRTTTKNKTETEIGMDCA